MLKKDEIASPNSCLNKSAEDEPIFVLRGHDLVSPLVVDMWIEYRIHHKKNTYEDAQIKEAKQLARQMREWQLKELNKSKELD